MTREEQYKYNAENYPASVLTWLNEATDRAYDSCEEEIKALKEAINIVEDACDTTIDQIIAEYENKSCYNCKFNEDIYCHNPELNEMIDEFDEMTNYPRVKGSFYCKYNVTKDE